MCVSACVLECECILFLHLEINFSKCHLFNRHLKSTTSSSVWCLLRISLVLFTHTFFHIFVPVFSFVYSQRPFVISAVTLLSASDLCPPCNWFLLFKFIFPLLRQSVKSIKCKNATVSYHSLLHVFSLFNHNYTCHSESGRDFELLSQIWNIKFQPVLYANPLIKKEVIIRLFTPYV